MKVKSAMPIPTASHPTAANRLRYIAALEDMLAKRTRLTIAVGILAFLAGIAFTFIIGMPPATYDPTTVCGVH